MGHITLGDVHIHYQIDGDGPWLTLVHGFSQHLHVWQPQVVRLADTYRLLRIDLRGHGGSSSPSEGYGPVEYAADVLGVRRQTHIRAVKVEREAPGRIWPKRRGGETQDVGVVNLADAGHILRLIQTEEQCAVLAELCVLHDGPDAGRAGALRRKFVVVTCNARARAASAEARGD